MKAWIRNAAVGTLRTGMRLAGGRARNLMSDALSGGTTLREIAETVQTARGKITFSCIGDLPVWRVRTLLTKEPETLEWIDSFAPGDVFWDIGANIGIYSLYAGIARNIRVLAFEPSAGNYFLLNRNIEKNGLGDHVQALCVAFSDATKFDSLNMQSTELGGALSTFADQTDNFGARFEPSFRQGMIGYSIDAFIEAFRPPFPQHVKIDVDGIEDKIVMGATKTLADRRLKSLSVELDSDRDDFTGGVVRALEAARLTCVAKRHAPMFETGKYKSLFNYQFRRTAE